jgi:unsaturated rhamnogalacturonyl hydrolase
MINKLLMLLLTITLLAVPFTGISCSSDDDDEDNIVAADDDDDDSTGLPDSLQAANYLIREWIENDPAMLWSWGDFVFFYGAWKLYEVSGDTIITDYIQNFIEEMSGMYQPIASDWLSPAALVLLMCEETGDRFDCDLVPQFDEYFEIVNREDGAIVHWTGGTEGTEREVWVDSLFMAGTYMLEKARISGEQEWFFDLADQFEHFDQILSDEETDLLNHGYDFTNEEFINAEGVYWARGNSWFIAALGNFLKILPENCPNKEMLQNLWVKRVEAILSWQDESGLWLTIIDQPDLEGNYTEASATALFAFGMAAGLNSGIEHEGARESCLKAVDALSDSIYEAGGSHLLPGTSVGTNPGSLEYYLEVGVQDNITYGVGAYVMAAVEAARLRGEIE